MYEGGRSHAGGRYDQTGSKQFFAKDVVVSGRPIDGLRMVNLSLPERYLHVSQQEIFLASYNVSAGRKHTDNHFATAARHPVYTTIRSYVNSPLNLVLPTM
jgi:hypothetical protein